MMECGDIMHRNSLAQDIVFSLANDLTDTSLFLAGLPFETDYGYLIILSTEQVWLASESPQKRSFSQPVIPFVTHDGYTITFSNGILGA